MVLAVSANVILFAFQHPFFKLQSRHFLNFLFYARAYFSAAGLFSTRKPEHSARYGPGMGLKFHGYFFFSFDHVLRNRVDLLEELARFVGELMRNQFFIINQDVENAVKRIAAPKRDAQLLGLIGQDVNVPGEPAVVGRLCDVRLLISPSEACSPLRLWSRSFCPSPGFTTSTMRASISSRLAAWALISVAFVSPLIGQDKVPIDHIMPVAVHLIKRLKRYALAFFFCRECGRIPGVNLET